MVRNVLLVLVALASGPASAAQSVTLSSLDSADDDAESQDGWPSGSHAPTAIRANQEAARPDAYRTPVHTF